MSAPDATFPVESFREAATHLRRPFTVQAAKFKVQSVTKNEPRKALVVAYIDARLVVERLNLVCPHLWSDAYEMAGKGLVCHLTVDGITRRDVGEGVGKALFSDALKRAAVKFGVGVSLYAIPQTWLDVDGRHVKQVGDNTYMQAAGERICRERYQEWLTAVGSKAFGEPLDHGDADDAQGDFEADVTPAATPDETPTTNGSGDHPQDRPLSESARAKIGQALAKSAADTGMVLAAAGFENLEAVRTVGDAHKVKARLDEAEAAMAEGATA